MTTHSLARSLPFLWILLLVSGMPIAAHGATGKPPAKPPAKVEKGIASWFRDRRPFVGAHRTIPIGSKVKVIARNGRSVVITIVGRGPFVKGRIVDLGSDAFKKLASLGTGLLEVRLEPIPPTPAKNPPAPKRSS